MIGAALSEGKTIENNAGLPQEYREPADLLEKITLYFFTLLARNRISQLSANGVETPGSAITLTRPDPQDSLSARAGGPCSSNGP
jgi:hypothetical protein